MTVNQALDKILTKYKTADMEKYPDIQTLKHFLIEIKVFGTGGNTKLENQKKIKQTIETGIAPK